MAESALRTPLGVIATVTRVVTKTIDRITGDRSDYPLLVAAVCAEALRLNGVESRVIYGPAAWIEILSDQTPIWAGCWGKNFHFWLATQYGEIADLNTSVAHRKRPHQTPELQALISPPLLWSADVPGFYRYIPEGAAEIELHADRDRQWFDLACEEVRQKCANAPEDAEPTDFPNEPILCPGRRILDDSAESFKHFDRALSVHGLPPAPF